MGKDITYGAVDHEGEVLESYVTKRETKSSAKFMKKPCVAMDHQTRSLQMSFAPIVQRQKS